jgi:hypothetical protein
MIGLPLFIAGKRRLKTISDVANAPSASVVSVWSPLSVAVKVTLTALGVGLEESNISKSPVPPKSPPSPPRPVDSAKELVAPGIFTPLEALAARELTRSAVDDAAPLALANAEAQLAEVALSLTWLNCGQFPNPLKLSSAVA